MVSVIFNNIASIFTLSSVLKGSIIGLLVYLLRPCFYHIYLIVKHGSNYTTFFKIANIDSFDINGISVKREDIICLYVPSEYSLDVKNKITGTIIGKTSENILYIKTDNGRVIAYSSWAIPLKDILFIKRKNIFSEKTVY